MNLFKFFKPKWQHSNPQVRLAAVREIGADKVELLATIIREDTELTVCQAALGRLADGRTLTALSAEPLRPELKGAIQAKLLASRIAAVLTAGSLAEQKSALSSFTDPRELVAIATEAEPALRLECIQRIGEQEVLCELLELSWGKEAALAAVAKINEPAMLARAMKSASNKAARRIAEEKYKALELALHPPDPAALFTAAMQELVQAAEKAVAEKYLPAGKEALAALAQTWLAKDPERSHPLYQEFVKLQERFAELWQPYQERMSKQERRAQLRAEQLAHGEASCRAIEPLLASVGEEANRLFQAAERQWQQALEILPGEVPSELQTRYTALVEKFHASRQTIAGEIEQRDLLAAQLAKLSGEPESKELEQRLTALANLEKKLLGSRFKYLPVTELREQLVALRTRWQERQREETATRARLRQENVDRHRQLLTELEALQSADDRLAAEVRVKELKGSWLALPPLPPEEGAQHQRYKELLDQFYLSQRQFHQEQSWQQWANQTKKEELLQVVEGLGAEEDLRTVYRVLREVQGQWKEIGSVPPKVSGKLWEKFRTACDQNFLRCKEYFEELDKQAEGNRLQKEELIRQAETFRGSTDWQATAEALKKLQAAWKEIGPAGKAEESKLAREFNGICDAFFAARKFHLAELDSARQANLKQKEALCQEAEELVAAPLPGLEAKFQELQAHWKKIGPVPKEVSEPIWQRFRAACDSYFKWVEELKPRNLAEKEGLCQEVEELVAGIGPDTNYKALAKEILARQDRWKEIGPVPKEDSEAIWQRFRSSCDAFFELQRQQFEAREAVRLENEEQKLALIHELEQLIGKTDRESASRAQELQQAWHGIGPATKGQERQIQQRFKEAADHFFNDRRALFAAQDAVRQENLKKKERLCVRLEVFSKRPQPNAALNLAEQLKLAMEANFMLAGQDPEQRRKVEAEEVNLIKQEWQSIGPVPHAHEQKLNRRFQAALAVSASNARELKGSDKAEGAESGGLRSR